MHPLAAWCLALMAVLTAATTSVQATAVTCTTPSPKYYTVTVVQTVTKLMLRPDDPLHLGRQLERNTLGRYMPLPAHGYLPPPAHGYLPPPAHGYLPPPAHGYLPPPAHGYLPPSAHGYVPPRTPTPTPITITPTAAMTAAVSAANIIVTPCRCDKCYVVAQENPCVCERDFSCGGIGGVRMSGTGH